MHERAINSRPDIRGIALLVAICLTGKSARAVGSFCPALVEKIFGFRRRANQISQCCRPAPKRGALRNVTERGAGCDGRGCAADEQHLMRTAKSGGSDALTLA